jgi:hypothetical protein
MDAEIERRLNELKKTFTTIIDCRSDIINTFHNLDVIIKKLGELYEEFQKNSKSKDKAFIFGLDSFHFQGKLIDIEYADMDRLFLAINNRMYCEYFKLYNIIIDYICENAKESEIIKNDMDRKLFPVYKDLEPFKQYDFEVVKNIHETIVSLLNSLYSFLIKKEHELKQHKNKANHGLNIDNFVSTFHFEIIMIGEKLILFIEYVEFFHKLHSKYLKRFATKIHLMHSQINSDIKLDDSSKKIKKNLLHEIGKDKLENNIMLELKESLHNNTPNFSDSEYDEKSTASAKESSSQICKQVLDNVVMTVAINNDNISEFTDDEPEEEDTGSFSQKNTSSTSKNSKENEDSVSISSQTSNSSKKKKYFGLF